MTTRDTIYALASGAGTVAISVIRAVRRPEPLLHSVLLRVRSRWRGGATCVSFAIQRRLRCWIKRWSSGFLAPASFTGEDCAEFHIHGGACGAAGRPSRTLAASWAAVGGAGRVHPACRSQRQAGSWWRPRGLAICCAARTSDSVGRRCRSCWERRAAVFEFLAGTAAIDPGRDRGCVGFCR